jgi:hypothetical protein
MHLVTLLQPIQVSPSSSTGCSCGMPFKYSESIAQLQQQQPLIAANGCAARQRAHYVCTHLRQLIIHTYCTVQGDTRISVCSLHNSKRKTITIIIQKPDRITTCCISYFPPHISFAFNSLLTRLLRFPHDVKSVGNETNGEEGSCIWAPLRLLSSLSLSHSHCDTHATFVAVVVGM